MHPKTLAAAITGALLLSAPGADGWGHGSQGHDLADHAPGSAPAGDTTAADAGAFEGLVIERTLGDGPIETIVVNQGAAVRLVLHAPPSTELHLHGYDMAAAPADGAPVVITFHAYHPGRFPIEAHGLEDVLGRAERALAYVEVRPE